MNADVWPEVTLADVCDSVDYGYTASASNQPVGPRFLRITDIVGGQPDWANVPYCDIAPSWVDRYRLRHGDIVIARTGASTGVSAYIPDPPDAVFASYLVRLRVGDGADARFVSYFLKSPEFWSYVRGVLGDKSAQPNASAKTLTRARLRLPPLREQRKIAEVLGAIDDKIELNRRMNETLEAMARAIFKSWFVDFDPVHAKIEGRPIRGMAGAASNQLPDSFEESTLGEIPSEWAVGSVRELISLSREIVDPAGSQAEAFDHYSIPAFDEGRVPATELGSDIRSNKFLVNSGVVLLSKLNPRFPRVWLPFPAPDRRSIASTEFLVCVPRPGLSREYLYSLICSDVFIERFSGLVTGTSGSHQRVKREDFLDMPVLLPSPSVVEAFAAMARPLLDRVAANVGESQTLATVRNTLLPKVFSGEISLR